MQTRCMNCMCLTEQTQGLCPKCGKSLQVSNDPPALAVSTILGQRYLIGAATVSNGEGYTYSALDMLSNEPVFIREFFPKGRMLRKEDGCTALIAPEDEQECLDWISSFITLHQKLKNMGSTNCIAPCREIFDENETAYAVIEIQVGKRTLQQYLDEYFDVLSWKQAEFLLTPLLYGLSGLNIAGIHHCGVCPENITVDEKGKVRLHHFVIEEARCVGSQMQHELYSGYSAPEQYIMDGKIGEWTDVYAFCAMLYRVLTGAMVPKANSRAISDVLTPPKELNPDIPDAVSKAIILGLNPNPEDRTQTFKNLLFNLYNEQSTAQLPKQNPVADKTIVIPAVADKGERTGKKNIRLIEDRKNVQPVKKPKVPVALLVLLISLPIVLTLFIATYTLLLGDHSEESSNGNISYADGISYQPDSSKEEISSTLSSESVENKGGFEVENFVGCYFEDIEDNAVYTSLYQFTAVYEYNDEVAKGQIIEQSIARGTIVPKGEAIEFLVSKGSKYFTLPAITDAMGKRKTGDAYAAELKAAGIPSRIEKIETNDYAEGKVVELSMSVGSRIDIENPEKVVIFVAKPKKVNSEDIFSFEESSDVSSESSSEESVPSSSEVTE